MNNKVQFVDLLHIIKLAILKRVTSASTILAYKLMSYEMQDFHRHKRKTESNISTSTYCLEIMCEIQSMKNFLLFFHVV